MLNSQLHHIGFVPNFTTELLFQKLDQTYTFCLLSAYVGLQEIVNIAKLDSYTGGKNDINMHTFGHVAIGNT
eukprot:5144266-Amphidinium_carterae.2